MKSNQSLLSNVLINIVIPVVILSKMSGEDNLGPTWALVAALAFPLLFGVYSFIQDRKVNFYSALGMISVLLTGGIGLLQLDPAYIAIKEAAIPGLIFVILVVSNLIGYPLVRKMLLNEDIVDHDKLHSALSTPEKKAEFERRVNVSSYLIAFSFFVSAVLNYGLAKWIVKSPAGTEAFNEEIGKMTALSFPVISLPVTILMMGALFYLFRSLSSITGHKMEDFLRSK
ncbi:MFS transporter [Vibrio cholerae]|uniref:VC0807 family protein n=1 Tax=Vibrio cholerae TaxID=666 RepID=UPI0011D5A71F|nr:VC0807 family protein [Vibrio cholerae]EGR2424964.1 MFS transporter [Vibrio cholerae]TXZ70877.1 MFS transporter [Vibrio cholerae]GHZ73187.1 putative membrane protein [Vibrio cholerae]HAS3566895.1 MFS transporter [Vibrio cholerae]